MGTKVVGSWSRERVLSTLATRIVMAGMQGKQSPIAALVLARIESAS